MNFFKFYDIEESFVIDQVLLKKKYLEKSRAHHPDHNQSVNSDAEEMTAFNNEAYKVLSDKLSTIKYVLELNDIELENAKLSNSFLMEMMDFNEKIEEVISNQPESKSELIKSIDEMEQLFFDEVSEVWTNYKADQEILKKESDLSKIKEYYLKMKYMNRLRSILNNQIEI